MSVVVVRFSQLKRVVLEEVKKEKAKSFWQRWKDKYWENYWIDGDWKYKMIINKIMTKSVVYNEEGER